jgi:hypothetical protein
MSIRIPTYLSYSAMALFESDIEEFYLRYLAPTRPPRIPQERPASIGSAFDAYAKSALHKDLGLPQDDKYELDALLTAQVEPHNLDWAREEGAYVFESYKVAGQYDMLLSLLSQSIEPPRFEFTVNAEINGVPFVGKPDCRFVLPGRDGPIHVIHDFKVSGYCGKKTVSPTTGYFVVNDGFRAAKQNKSHGQPHKLYTPLEISPSFVIDSGCLEDRSTSWADQLTLYGWALGEKIGDPVVLSIDQLVAKPIPGQRPLMRVASYRARVRRSYQEHLAKRLKDAWNVITSGHIFRTLSFEDSNIRCQLLNDQSKSLQVDAATDNDWFSSVVRPKYRG